MESILRLVTVFVILCLTAKEIASNMTSDGETWFDKDLSNLEQCPLQYCSNNSSESGIVCRCDSSCWRRGDCCPNYLNQTNVNNQTFYFGIPKAVIEQGQLYECYAINQYEANGQSVISKCGHPVKDVTDSWLWQKSQCEQPVQYENATDILLKIPVSSKISGETYRNIYCAACHSDLGDILLWNTRVSCSQDSQVSNWTEALQHLYLNERSICNLVVVPPPDIKTFKCSAMTTSLVSTCPQSFVNTSTSPEDTERRREIEWLCHITSYTANINGNDYKNPFCAACNFNETDVGAVVHAKHGACSTNLLSNREYDVSVFGGKKSFSVLLDFDFSITKGNMVGMSHLCHSGSIYDVFTKQCRSLMCSSGYQYHDGHCQPQGMAQLVDANYTYENSSECPKMRLKRNEVVINENGTITAHQQILYPEGTFELIDNDTVYVCVDISDNYVFDFDGDAHVYMTLVCSLLSLLALLLKMVLFALTSQIRKFPDKLVFCLSASLFMAHLFFLTTTMSSTTNYIACASVGVLTHYFFLSSFCWMNVLAYDIWNTLSQCIESRFIHSDILKCRFCCYSVYAWVTPMLIVSAACVFDWSGIVDEFSIMRPYYGVVMCWISTRTALLFYFAIPMALLLSSNIAFFILTTVSICRSSRKSSIVESAKNSRNSGRNHHLRFSIYVKLAVIMGLTWISGFVAAFSGQEWLWYVFTLTSASQGVYILIALTPFKKVIHILQLRCQSRGRKNMHLHDMNFSIGNDSKHSHIVISSLENINS